MSNNINDTNNFTLMFTEIIKLSSALQQLSSNVDAKINKLPDNKDFDASIKKLEKIIDEIDNINSFINKSGSTDISMLSSITDIKSTLTDIKSTLIEKKKDLTELLGTSEEIKELLNNSVNIFTNIHNVICNDNSDLMIKINNINGFTNDIKKQVYDSYVKLNKNINLHDFDAVIEFAKRSNDRHKFWKGWKAITAVVIGGIIGISALMNNLKWLVEMFFG